MTPIDRARLTRFLAIKVMRWETTDASVCYYAPSEDGIEAIPKAQWNPLKSFADCEPLFDKIERDRWVISIENYDGWVVGLVPRGATRSGYSAQADTLTEALCLAIAKAYGYQEVEP